MKTLPVWIAGIVLFAANAPAQVTGEEDFLQTEAARRARENPPTLKIPRPNEITVGNISYDGIFVQVAGVAVADNPLQLFNPAAAPQFGAAEDNLVRDPITGRASGLKLFSIEF